MSLDAAQSAHALKVKRRLAGSEIELFDGRGNLALGRIIDSSSKNQLAARIESIAVLATPPLGIHLVTAIPKSDRMETLIDMVTQLGAVRITPVIFEHSVKLTGSKRTERWGRVAIEACKQSGINFIPVIDVPVLLHNWLTDNEISLAGRRWLADPAGEPVMHRLYPKCPLTQTVVIIGPEGGLTPNETERLHAVGYQSVALGTGILRIEAAAIAFATLVASERTT